MKVLSLFDWISCARVALDRAGIPIDNYYASEVDKYAIQIAQKNYPDTIHVWSVVWYNHTGQVDLLIWWSPCQDLSIAKKDRQWLEWSKSSLFRQYVSILREVKPKRFILENVASMSKEAKETITREMGVEPIMINASLVSAQNRKRLFRTNIPWVTQPDDKGILLKDILQDEVGEKYFVNISERFWLKWLCEDKAKSMSASQYKWYWSDGVSIIRVWHYNKWWQWDRVYSPEWKSVTLSALWWWRGAKTWLYLQYDLSWKWHNSQDQRAYYDDWKHWCLAASSTQSKTWVLQNHSIRKLTPIECERLQCLPDNYTEWVSNSQRYKMLGNGFNVDVVAHILSFIPR